MLAFFDPVRALAAVTGMMLFRTFISHACIFLSSVFNAPFILQYACGVKTVAGSSIHLSLH
jgi:hypothetical protein